MKKLILLLTASALFIAASTVEVKKDSATVHQAQGMYIFMQSKPLAEYTVLGTVQKTGIAWTGHPEEMFNIILRRAKKDYPNCEAVIFDGVDMKHATCIKFK